MIRRLNLKQRIPAEFWVGGKLAAPLAVAVGGFGFSFGLLAITADIPAVAAIVMSVTTFAGSAQFAAASVLSSDGSVVAATAAAVLLNSRYLPIGISVAPALGGSWPRRLLEAQLVVDESWAVGHIGDGQYERGRLLGAGLLIYGAWVGGTALGTTGGEFIGDPQQFGLDAAFPALFLALLVKQLHNRRAVVAAILGAVLALALTPVLAPGLPLLVASLACLTGWSR